MRQDSEAKLNALASPDPKYQPKSSANGSSVPDHVKNLPTPAKGGSASASSTNTAGTSAAAAPAPAPSGPALKPSKFWTSEQPGAGAPSSSSVGGLEDQIPTSLAAVQRDRKGKNAFFETIKYYYQTREGYHVFPSWLEPDKIRDGQGRR